MRSAHSEDVTTRTVQGTVLHVDVVARELVVAAADGRLVLAVPPACPVWLNRERVKLRLLQPQDPVAVTYALVGGQAVATSVRVVLPCGV
jgi:hypothetical protein